MANLLSLVQPPYIFIVPAIYSVILIVSLPSRLKLLAAAVAAVLSVATQAILISFGSAALSVLVGLSVAILLALLNITGRATTLLLAVCLFALPPGAWIYPLGGLMVAGLVSTIIVWRKRGTDYLRMSTAETLASVGLVGGTLQKPDLSRLPIEDSAEAHNVLSSSRDKNHHMGKPLARTPRVSIPAFMLASLVLGGIVGVAGGL